VDVWDGKPLVNSDKIGIVVIGRNEGQRLVDCLNSLKDCGAKVIYVDSGSTDGSVAAGEKIGASVVRLDSNDLFTAARARNEGFKTLLSLEPDTEFVQFIDGDCQLVPTWLSPALSFISESKEVAVVCGRRREGNPGHSIYNRLCDIEWDTPIGEALACGGDSLMRTDVFEAVGGYNSKLLSGEEPELCGRIRDRGWKVWRLDAEMTRHDAAMARFRQWWRRAVRSGYGEAEIAKLHPMVGAEREKKEVARAVIWAGVIPLIIVAATFLRPVALAGIAVYPLQVGRIAIRRGVSKTDSWAYALFMTIAKFAQLQGNLRFWWHSWRKTAAKPIEYK
jgi:glycosyltransferase involved in cell wall biosynthesis